MPSKMHIGQKKIEKCRNTAESSHRFHRYAAILHAYVGRLIKKTIALRESGGLFVISP